MKERHVMKNEIAAKKIKKNGNWLKVAHSLKGKKDTGKDKRYYSK